MVQNMMSGYPKKISQLRTYFVSSIRNTWTLLDLLEDSSFAPDRPIPGNIYRRRVVAFLKGGVVSGYTNKTLYFPFPFPILSSVHSSIPHSFHYRSFPTLDASSFIILSFSFLLTLR